MNFKAHYRMLKTEMLKASLVIIVSGRRMHLENLLNGITLCSTRPSEIVIVYMDDDPPVSTRGLNIQEIRINEEHSKLPLAKARNTGARSSSFDSIIFLDVDCIPHSDFFKEIMSDHHSGGVTMGSPLYLEKPITDLNMLQEFSKRHPHLEYPNKLTKESDYNQFWSLCFSIEKETFEKIGGFCEDYKGYGAEDTDFGQKLHKYGVTLYRSPARVYHQFHSKYDPPLNHFKDIISNSQLFYKRWGFLPMMNWLKEFEELNYIQIQEKGNIKILRSPGKSEVKNCLSSEPW